MPRITRPWKIVFTLLLLAALAWGIDWREMPAHLARIDATLGMLALLIVVLEMPVNAWKWSWSLRLHDLRFPWIYLFRTACFGFFFNNLLPSAIGGDVYRVIRTTEQASDRSRAISAVLVDRVVGLAAMLCNGLLGALVLMQTYELARWYVQAAAVGLVALVVGFGLLYKGTGLRRKLSSIRFLQPVWDNLRRIGRPRREWLPLIATSFLFQLLAALCLYLSFAAVGAEIAWPAALLITAAAGIGSILPLSISGIGVVEGSIAGTAVALGVDYDLAVLGAIALRLITLPVSAACGLLYLTESGETRAQAQRLREE